MSRKAKVCTMSALKDALATYTSDLSEFPYNLPQRVQDDLQKIEFDMENAEIDPPGFCGYPCGYEVLSNGLPVLFVNAGGDWEFPICFVLYLDNKNTVRGYIPKNGNVYNTARKTAYGNTDGDPDVESNDPCLKVNAAAIRADIISRIKIIK